MQSPTGAFLIHKPQEFTSSDVVTKLKWAMINQGYAEKGFRIGHGGTLDPFATGVLIVLFGEATKLADTYLHSSKTYEGVITLGKQTDTGDLTGSIISEKAVPELSEKNWQSLAQAFTEEAYFQTPPMYSAKKKDGVSLHELARKGIEVERAAILKKISKFEVTFRSESELNFVVACESGTYVRVIAEDLAKKANTVAHLKTLNRIQSSDVKLSDCTRLDSTIRYLEEKLPLEEFGSYRPLSALGTHVPSLSITEDTVRLLRNGIQNTANQLAASIAHQYPSARYALARCENKPVALFEKPSEIGGFRLQRVFN